jgi:hypothetical protein
MLIICSNVTFRSVSHNEHILAIFLCNSVVSASNKWLLILQHMTSFVSVTDEVMHFEFYSHFDKRSSVLGIDRVLQPAIRISSWPHPAPQESSTGRLLKWRRKRHRGMSMSCHRHCLYNYLFHNLTMSSRVYMRERPG